MEICENWISCDDVKNGLTSILLTFGLFKRLIRSFCYVASWPGCRKLLWLCQRGQLGVDRR